MSTLLQLHAFAGTTVLICNAVLLALAEQQTNGSGQSGDMVTQKAQATTTQGEAESGLGATCQAQAWSKLWWGASEGLTAYPSSKAWEAAALLQLHWHL